MKIILASLSPRRAEILRDFGFDFEIQESSFSEVLLSSPIETIKENSLGKAREVFNKNPDAIIIAGDTIPYLNGKYFPKPKDKQEAVKIISGLSGKTHEVYSGFAIVSEGKEIFDHEVSRVTFKNLSKKDIEDYVLTGEWEGRSGGYACKDKGSRIIEKIEGSSYAVQGFPIEKFLEAWVQINQKI